MITAGKGKLKVWLEEYKLTEERIYILGGGERSHIGGVIVKEPGKEMKVIKFEGHYDHIVLEPIAEEASKKYDVKVVAIGGVHVDNATKEEIDTLVKNCKELVKCI